MRRGFVRSAIVLGLLVIALIGWMLGAGPLSLVLDGIHTVQIDSTPVAELGIEDAAAGAIRINALLMSTAQPDDRPFPITIATDNQARASVTIGGDSITLGPVTHSRDTGSELVMKPEANDHANFSTSRSLISWPTPLDLNFMTGHSPSWKRHLYYRLLWQKPNGAKLEMLWRYRQFYYASDGWTSGFMTHPNDTGLLRAKIQR